MQYLPSEIGKTQINITQQGKLYSYESIISILGVK